MGAVLSGSSGKWESRPSRPGKTSPHLYPTLHSCTLAALHRCSVAPLQPLGPAEDPTAPKDNRREDRQPPYIEGCSSGIGRRRRSAIAMQDASTNTRSFATRKAGPRRVRGGCGRSTQQGTSTHRAPRTCAGTCPTPKGYYGVLTVPLERVLAPALLPRGTTEYSPCPSNVCWHLPVRMSQNCSGFTSV